MDRPVLFAIVGVEVVPGGSVGMFPVIGGKVDSAGGNDVACDDAYKVKRVQPNV